MQFFSQDRAPVLEALEKFKTMRIVPFDVPGHKRGRGNPELTEFLGERCLSVDVNSMKMLDNLCHPVSVLRDAQMLAAEAFGAANAFFIINHHYFFIHVYRLLSQVHIISCKSQKSLNFFNVYCISL